ncbi:pentapeptide repeat-containing protein, partial [Conchiformibius steedae]|uniref:pentapeptide repeat-containing protein n=1 Tax=Conchiformibius steedae TaxID=153493 RepID=UPI0026EF65CF
MKSHRANLFKCVLKRGYYSAGKLNFNCGCLKAPYAGSLKNGMMAASRMEDRKMDTSQNTLTQQQLDEIIDQHRLWLETDGKDGQRANLSGQRLIGLKLSGADLEGAILFRVNLSGADLRGIILSGESLEEANLSGANLSGAILSGTILARANLSGANLSGAILFRVNLSGADLGRANIEWTDLDNTDITVAQNWQYAIGINTILTDKLSQKLQQQNQEIEQLKAELAAAKASEQAGGQDAENISHLED